MYSSATQRPALVLVLPLALTLTAGCQAPAEDPATAKIPVTTSSEEARNLFLQGRELNDKLRFTDSHEYFEQAVDLDPDFAWAHLLAGFTGSTAQEFWDDLELAVAAAEGASEGERLLILATEAGAKGNPEQQLAYLNELIVVHPGDERAHNALGAVHFGRQEYEEAVVHYQRAIDINPDFSPPYNQKGYAHRFLGDFDAAEASFTKYIELIPDDPNPYDSYAELLMKAGRFEESIARYRQALEQDPHFVASYVGIANNHMFMGQMDEARAALDELSAAARNVGESRAALFWVAHTHLHEGAHDAALEAWEERYALAEGDDDRATMAGDLNFRGDILTDAGRFDEAAASYAQSIEMIERADVAPEVKENAQRNILYDEARLALARGDLESARTTTVRYDELVGAKQIPFELRQLHELAGMIALADGDAAAAITQLDHANQRNPRVLLHLARAHEAVGDLERAADYAGRAANFNALSVTFSMVRAEAQEMVAALSE